MTKRMVASNRAPLDAISDCSTLLDPSTNPVATTIRTIRRVRASFSTFVWNSFRQRYEFQCSLYVYIYVCVCMYFVVYICICVCRSIGTFFRVCFFFFFCLKLFWLLGASCFFVALSFFWGKEQSRLEMKDLNIFEIEERIEQRIEKILL